jgi:hypothetical protein
MNREEIRKQEQSLRRLETLTKEQELELEELSLRSMIMSCLVYGEDIFTSVCINACSEYYNKPYAEEYIDILGYDRVMEVYNDQKNYFDTKCKVEKNVYTDCEGVTYNSLVEVE